MDPKDISRQVFDAIRETNKIGLEALDQIQKQNEKLYKLLVSQAGAAQDQGTKMVEEWMETSADMRKKYEDQFEANLKKVEDFLSTLQ
jgi:polyhydroxyalkanoate synthesis regulator phasin